MEMEHPNRQHPEEVIETPTEQDEHILPSEPAPDQPPGVPITTSKTSPEGAPFVDMNTYVHEQREEGPQTSAPIPEQEKTPAPVTKDLLTKHDLGIDAWATAEVPITKQIEYLRGELQHLRKEVTQGKLQTELNRVSSELSKLVTIEEEFQDLRKRFQMLKVNIDAKLEHHRIRRITDDLKKIDSKIVSIQEEVGIGDTLNVSKIPPYILEIVYEATIADVVDEIWHHIGAHDAEIAIMNALEDIRTRTSGSELFKFDGRRLVTRNLARSIKNNLISAKQIQTTYHELLHKLLEYVPGYKPKNFQAMIKIKSQEYAVDKTTSLVSRHENLRKYINMVEKNMDTISYAMHEQITIVENKLDDKLEAFIDKIREQDLRVFKEDIDSRVEGLEAQQSILETLIGELREQLMVQGEQIAGLNIDGVVTRLDSIDQAIERLSQGVLVAPPPAAPEVETEAEVTAESEGSALAVEEAEAPEQEPASSEEATTIEPVPNEDGGVMVEAEAVDHEGVGEIGETAEIESESEAESGAMAEEVAAAETEHEAALETEEASGIEPEIESPPPTTLEEREAIIGNDLDVLALQSAPKLEGEMEHEAVVPAEPGVTEEPYSDTDIAEPPVSPEVPGPASMDGMAEQLPEEEAAIFDLVEDDWASVKTIKASLPDIIIMSERRINELLMALVEREMVDKKKRGRLFYYRRKMGE